MNTLPTFAGVTTGKLPDLMPRLCSGVGTLDDFLTGGLPFGTVTEWGVPLGRGGRLVVARFLASATQGRQLDRPLLALWVQAAAGTLDVYPPAWRAQGVDLTRVRFARSARPVADLKPLLMDPLFKVIIIDAPERLSTDDIAYIARQARINGQLVVILRNYMLSSERGNVWAKLRMNCWYEPFSDQPYRLQVVRGFSFQRLSFDLDEAAS